jgi:hypothetical protein
MAHDVLLDLLRLCLTLVQQASIDLGPLLGLRAAA